MIKDHKQRLKDAAGDFKGAASGSNIPEARQVLEVVETVKTGTLDSIPTVAVYFRKGEEINEAVENIVERYNLTRIDEEAGANTVYYYTTEEIAEENFS